jgi:hypothetical protein
MAVTAKWFGVPLASIVAGTETLDWDANTIKVSLHTSAWTPAQDTHDYANDASNELSTAGGYTAGGQTLTSKTVTYDTTSDEIRMDATDAQWTSASFSAYYAAIWKDSGNSATSPLLAYVDFGGTETVSSGTFTIQWDSTGVLKLDVT